MHYSNRDCKNKKKIAIKKMIEASQRKIAVNSQGGAAFLS
jgi:hypothetical protein